MKPSSPALSAATALLAAALAVTSLGQTTEPPQQPSGTPATPPHRTFPPPTNLQVLPKDSTADQVHQIMRQWAGELGTECSTCHAADPKNIGPNGRPRLNFADDSKKEKATARLMYKMVDEINTQYVGKIDSSGMPVTCGTCHRGKLTPDPYIPPKEEGHDPPAPPTPPAGLSVQPQ